jgi:Tfp pilus assembly protein FimT
MVLVCAVMAVVASVAIPVTLAGVERSRGWAAARFVAARFLKARAEAVARGAAVALRVDGAGTAARIAAYRDGNHNGVLTREIADGTDPVVDPPVPLSSLFPGVALVFDEGEIRLFSFSPEGTATTASLFLTSRDGTRFAVRVLGATARVRIERFVPARGAWSETF